VNGETTLIIGKAVIWFAIPAAFAAYQIWSVSRALAERAEKEARDEREID